MTTSYASSGSARCWKRKAHDPHTWRRDLDGQWYDCDGTAGLNQESPSGTMRSNPFIAGEAFCGWQQNIHPYHEWTDDKEMIWRCPGNEPKTTSTLESVAESIIDEDRRRYALHAASQRWNSAECSPSMIVANARYFEDYLRGDGSLTLSAHQVEHTRALLAQVDFESLPLVQMWLEMLPDQLKPETGEHYLTAGGSPSGKRVCRCGDYWPCAAAGS